MVVRPAVIPFVHDLVMLCMEVQKQELFQNLTCTNETECPSFLSWCELRKWKLIQSYGLSYTRHHNGVFCRAMCPM